MGRAGRTSEPCKHSIIIVVRENTDLSSISRLVGSAPLVLRVALKIMTARASMLRLLPPLPPPSPLLVVLFHRTLPRFFFVTSLTDRPWWAEFPETKEERGDGRGRFFFSIVFTRRVFKRFAREEFFWRPKSRVQWALGYFAAMVHADMANGKRICRGKLLYFIRWIFYIILYSLV